MPDSARQWSLRLHRRALHEQARFRVGKLKTPFGIERLQSGQSLSAERALPNFLVPNRDIGPQVHGELIGGAFGYQLAVLNGVADGGSATQTRHSMTLPVVCSRSRSARKAALAVRLGFGVAARRGRRAVLCAGTARRRR